MNSYFRELKVRYIGFNYYEEKTVKVLCKNRVSLKNEQEAHIYCDEDDGCTKMDMEQIANYLNKKGYNITLVIEHGSEDDIEALKSDLSNDNVYYH